MYYPSRYRDEDGLLQNKFNPADLKLRTVSDTLQSIEDIANSSGMVKADLQAKNGITEGSLLFQLPNIVRYTSIPADIMQLFYNISKDMFTQWCGGGSEPYSPTDN